MGYPHQVPPDRSDGGTQGGVPPPPIGIPPSGYPTSQVDGRRVPKVGSSPSEYPPPWLAGPDPPPRRCGLTNKVKLLPPVSYYVTRSVINVLLPICYDVSMPDITNYRNRSNTYFRYTSFLYTIYFVQRNKNYNNSCCIGQFFQRLPQQVETSIAQNLKNYATLLCLKHFNLLMGSVVTQNLRCGNILTTSQFIRKIVLL